MSEIIAGLSTALADRYKIERDVGEGAGGRCDCPASLTDGLSALV